MELKTEQEKFWVGDFGDKYIKRNEADWLTASNLHFFSSALKFTGKINSCIEFGANIGMNLKALKLLYPGITVKGIEINKTASDLLEIEIGKKNVYNESILDIEIDEKFDISIIKGVLIHINPEFLDIVYKKLYEVSNSYILIAEYYNPTPMSIMYRGHSDKLFKRDFAGDFLEKFPDVKLVDYGFIYKKDPAFPQDDITWFLLKK